MTTAEKIYENFIETYGADYRRADLEPFIEKEAGGSVVSWSGDYYSNNSALFDDGSEIVWNYKNEIEVY